MKLRIEESRDNGRSLYGIFVRNAGKEGQALAVTAAQGTFLATDDPDTIIFRLKNGVLVHDSPKYEAPRILTFNSHDLPIDLPQIDSFRGRGNDDLDLPLPALVRVGTSRDRPSVVRGKSVSVRCDLRGPRILIKNKKNTITTRDGLT